MGSKNVSLRDEAYDRLASLKREGESFSDVVLRVTEDDKWRGFGALSDSGVREGMERAHEDLNDAIGRNLEETDDDDDRVR